MTESLSKWRRYLPHTLSLSLILLLWLTAWSAFYAGGKGRSWWWSAGNDACQAFAAQSVSMRLGAPIQNVVWPGATLATPYLYATALSADPGPPPLSVTSTEAILNRAVQFHWAQAGVYGLALLVLVYALTVRWSRSPTIGFLASGLIASNNWFLWGLFHVRAEIPSLVFALAACWWAVANRPKAWPIARPAVFGALMALAVLSKIQIVPVLPLCLYVFITTLRDLPRTSKAKRQWAAVLVSSVLCLLGILCMIRTEAINLRNYGLGGLPSNFSNAVAVISFGAVITGVFLARSPMRRISAIASQSVLMGGGAVLGLSAILIPILLHGGVSVAVQSANRIVFGTLAYARYGQQLPSAGGWGFKSAVVDRVTSFVEFQNSSGLISGSLVIWTGVLIVLCAALSAAAMWMWPSRSAVPATTSVPRPNETSQWNLPALLFITAILCDVATTHRTVTTTSYTFYHIYSQIFYVLAASTAVGNLISLFPHTIRTSAPIKACGSVIPLLATAWLLSTILSGERVRLWTKEEGTAEAYLQDKGSSTAVIFERFARFWIAHRPDIRIHSRPRA